MFIENAFETLINRITVNADGIYAIMSMLMKKNKEMLFQDHFISEFVSIRNNCEKEVHINMNQKENGNNYSLDDIYDLIQYCYGLSNKQVNYLIDIEKKLEKSGYFINKNTYQNLLLFH